MNTKQIVFVIAHNGYQHIEYGVPKKLLEQTGHHVITASNKPGTATGKDGSQTQVDMLVKDVDPTKFNGIIFIGGPGALEHLDNEVSYALAQKAAEASKIVGAICVATRILAKSGVLKGKKATGWNGDDQLPGIYKEYGVNYVPEDVIVDKNIVTATGPSAAQEFGSKIISMLDKQ